MSSTDVAVAAGEPEPESVGRYIALMQDPAETEAIIADNLGGQEITEFDLPRIRVPSGGGKTWEVPTLDGGVDGVQTLEGIVVHFKLTRAYWPGDAASGTPPACRSNDGVVGQGDPGGACRSCPHSAFGTATNDRGEPAPGQACNAREVWFMLRHDSVLPVAVALPATSLKAAKSYRIGTLGSAGKRMSSVITRLSLSQQRNGNGDTYSQAVPSVGAMLDADQAAHALAYAARFRPLFDQAAAAMAAAQE